MSAYHRNGIILAKAVTEDAPHLGFRDAWEWYGVGGLVRVADSAGGCE